MSGRFRTVVALLSSWVVVGVLASLAPVSASAAVSTPGGFTSLSPSRLLDTRAGVGAPKAPVSPGGTVHLKVTGRGGVPAFGVSAVVLNVTVTAPTRAGYLTVYGDGFPRPTASNLNFIPAQTVPNLVIAPVGVGGKVDLYNGSTGTVQLIADVSGYYRSEAPVTGYAAYAWGSHESGQLGDGTTTDRLAPVRVGTDTHWASVEAGVDHTVAVKTDGTLWSWGTNEFGQLGDGTTTDRSTPVRVGIDTHWASVTAGCNHSVALKTDGTLWAWGGNWNGQLGDGTGINRHAPVRVGSDAHWASVEAGGAHTVAVKTDGTLWGWGFNGSGRLGDGTNTERHEPVQVGSETHWASAAGGGDHTVAVKTDGTLWAWGDNEYGQLGDGTSTGSGDWRTAPVQVGSDTHWA